MTYETGDTHATWTEGYIDGCCWCEVDEEYRYRLSGPGYEISPTRTPWAWWWRPGPIFDQNSFWGDIQSTGDVSSGIWIQWYSEKARIGTIFYRTPCDNHTEFHGQCVCGQIHHLPDIAEDNPQGIV